MSIYTMEDFRCNQVRSAYKTPTIHQIFHPQKLHDTLRKSFQHIYLRLSPLLNLVASLNPLSFTSILSLIKKCPIFKFLAAILR
mmetsp:Transcript_23165/g.26239  ORF Transcript_23165/g.26239 Transcript_23165/m.26239 type:complete len:84 (+) Transcript_23165:482-733(+)